MPRPLSIPVWATNTPPQPARMTRAESVVESHRLARENGWVILHTGLLARDNYPRDGVAINFGDLYSRFADQRGNPITINFGLCAVGGE